jgi:hypothetical protein
MDPFGINGVIEGYNSVKTMATRVDANVSLEKRALDMSEDLVSQLLKAMESRIASGSLEPYRGNEVDLYG